MFTSFSLIFFRLLLLASEGTLHYRKTRIITASSTFLGRLWPELQNRIFARDVIFLEPRSIYGKHQESLENYSLSLLVVFASIFLQGLVASCLNHRYQTLEKWRDTWIKLVKLSVCQQKWNKSPQPHFCSDLCPETNLIVSTQITASINQINTFL